MSSIVRNKKNFDDNPKPAWRSASACVLGALTLILALGSYNASDPSLNTFSSNWSAPKNVLGYFGSWTSDLFFQLFGYAAWLCPLILAAAFFKWLSKSDKTENPLKTRDGLALLTAIGSLSLFFALGSDPSATRSFPSQGLIGVALSSATIPLFGKIGSYLVAFTLAWIFSLVWWEELPLIIFRACAKVLSLVGTKLFAALSQVRWGSAALGVIEKIKNIKLPRKAPTSPTLAAIASKQEAIAAVVEEDDDEDEEELEASDEDSDEEGSDENGPVIRERGNGHVWTAQKAKTSTSAKPASSNRKNADDVNAKWELPPLSLLSSAKAKVKGPSEEQLRQVAKKIKNALQSFEIEGDVTEIVPGPIITMYEFQPAMGVRVNKLVGAATDLAMTLGVQSVRVVAPIPGKSVAGIEVPNAIKEEIVLKDVIEQTQEVSSRMKVPLVLGKDIEGNPVAADLATMPHLLVGGATSMGKSVLVNSMLTGLLCRFTPRDLRLIVVDPKLVEFKIFEDLPHLLLPIVNDSGDASQALKWAVGETKRRYVEMQKIAAKNIEAYNKKASESKDGELEKFPYIVIVIDELAELMLTAKKDVEVSISRLSQLARAAGLHLIMATQRPSADVVTGLIKSNCPSRAALRVASGSDSRIILDTSGAEQLLGRGDMFFTNSGPMGLKRIQGSFVSDDEIERVCNFWREQGEPSYREEILAQDEDALAELEAATEDLDELYAEVLGFARERGKVSTSLIQRRFQIGYNRAARIMDQLEARGVVGEAGAAGKPRDVIM